MNIKRNLFTSFFLTIVTTVLLGILYPLAITGCAQLFMKNKADGQLILNNGTIVGSRIIGQPFSGPEYFHARPSAAGNGYDAANSGASNLGPTNHVLIDRVEAAARELHSENPTTAIPIDLVTTSGSGLDPDITPAAAAFQVPMVARARRASPEEIEQLVTQYTKKRQFDFLGEPRVNVLELNMALDRMSSK